jgi:exopolysaccharide production protein ExoZ
VIANAWRRSVRRSYQTPDHFPERLLTDIDFFINYSSMKEGQISAIQVLRGVAVLGVVIFHCTMVQQKYSLSAFQMPKIVGVGQSGVDLFFVISGFVMVTVTHGRFGSRAQMSRFLYRRATRIYPTYWFYCLLTLAVVFVKPAWVNASQGNHINVWSSLVLLPDRQLPIVMVAWSLIHELWFYLVFSVLLLFSENKVLPALIVWCLAIIGINLAVDPETLSPGLRLICHGHTLEFIFGSLAAILLRSAWTKRIPSGVLLAILIVAFVSVPLAYHLRALRYGGLIRTSVFGLLYAAILCCLVLLEPKHRFATPRFLRFVGDISYSTYLCHILVLSAIGRLFAAVKMQHSGIGGSLLVWALMLGAVLSFAWISYQWVERPVLDLSRSLGDRLLNISPKVATSKA